MRTRCLMPLFALIVSLLQCKANNCGYQACHSIKDGHINVHLIPHSHDDVGWVKTVDQFYYGTNSFSYRASVQTIYDNVLKAVQKNTQRRFIYVESAFFWKWWQEQTNFEREQLQQLVSSGQIEFAGGGWSMNDEAVVNYQSVVDQMSWGLKKLNESFGDCGRPRAGWQIDPFGHSNEMASIFARLGYDGVILGRIDYEDKNTRLANKSMEMVWRGSKSLGRQTDIFTTTLYNHYDAPAGFCFDILCEDSVNLVDDIKSPEYNIDIRAKQFIIEHVKDSLQSFQTNNVIVPMGRDFAYQEAETWFRNIDKLIKYINKHETFEGKKYNLIYSTPSCYIAAVQKQSKGMLTSPLKLDDFFPYATDPNSYWTGYYTSRPTLKRYERLGNNFLQICKQLYALANLPSEFEPQLDSLRDAMGVMQHHDAITGTEKETVAYDYARLLDIGINDCENITSEALSSFTNIEANDFNTCLLTNISQCHLTETYSTFVVTVYNPLSRLVSKYVRLPVNGNSFSVTGPDGKSVHNQILPTALGVRNITGRQTNASLELIFEAQDIPGLGFKSFYVQGKNGDDIIQEDLSLDFSYSNRNGVGFTIDPSTGLVNTLEMNNIHLDFEQKFWYYNGSNGWSDFASRASGAYIFKPDTLNPINKVSDTAAFETYRGNLVTEVHQTFSDYVSQTIRIYENEKFVEFDWVVGPLNTEPGWPSHGKEVISRFTTSLNSESTFYTDSNGRELMKRQRNRRPSWNVTVLEEQASNYYPVTSKILIRDEEANLEFAVLTDRAEGGSSLADGEIELMLLRTCVSDDQLGVSEALTEMAYNEPIIARGSHYATLGNIKSEQTIASIEQEIATKKLLDSWIFLSVPTETNFADYKKAHSMQFSGLKTHLPQNVHIMTLEPWTKSSYLLRLEHVFEIEQDPILSQPVTVNLKDLFTTFKIKSIRETTLGANQWLKDSQRLNFQSAFQSDEEDLSSTKRSEDLNEQFGVDLEPMEIRTFIIEVVPKL